MTFREGLIRARSHIVFILALLVAFPLMLALDSAGEDLSQQGNAKIIDDMTDKLLKGEHIPLAERAALRPDQIGWGRIAWRYFEHNINPDTGLANSANGYPSTTMWDTGSFLLGLIAAERIGLIDRANFDERTGRALVSLGKIPLFDGVLPNKAYDTRTLSMVDYNNKPTSRGLGWSALDIARIMIPLSILERSYDEHTAAARRVVSRWHLDRIVRSGVMIGATVDQGGKTTLHQEGRIGYEEYAAKALILNGLDAYQAWRTDDTVTFRAVEGVQVPVDSRSADNHGAQVYTTSEPYVLDGLEFGFDSRSRAFAEQVYRAQESRHAKSGILTAVSEGHLDRAPHFAYATVVGNSVPWAVLAETGERCDELRTLSTKTVFGLDALYATTYTALLMQSAVSLNNPAGGWFEGRYEKGGAVDGVETANTNGVILETLSYRAFGPLLDQAYGGG